jgi:hypothetical protein
LNVLSGATTSYTLVVGGSDVVSSGGKAIGTLIGGDYVISGQVGSYVYGSETVLSDGTSIFRTTANLFGAPAGTCRIAMTFSNRRFHPEKVPKAGSGQKSVASVFLLTPPPCFGLARLYRVFC